MWGNAVIALKEILDAARSSFEDVRLCYLHPVLYLIITCDSLELVSEDHRLDVFAKKTGFDTSDLQISLADLEVSILLLTKTERIADYAFITDQKLGGHWLPLFDKQLRDQWAQSLIHLPDEGASRAIHFYGFKGGQARSTVLAMLGKSLAESGYRVLLVDVDIEAPSLATVFQVASSTLSSTLVGVVRGNPLDPIAVQSTKAGGCLHMLPTRPSNSDFDMEFASFALRVTLDAASLERAVVRIREQVNSKVRGDNYDYVLFDHRTGLSTTVLPVLQAWPGSVVISTRADGLSLSQSSVIPALLAANASFPGAFVCFSLDPEKRKGVMNAEELKLREELLGFMAEAISRGADPDFDTDITDLGDYFVPWYHDRAFLEPGVPDIGRVSSDNIDSLRQLREVLGISSEPAIKTVATPPPVKTMSASSSPSGSLDGGWFVETPDAARLLQTNLPSYYVFGRKGTGKTRLFRELSERGLALPLHSAADFKGGGVQAQSGLASSIFALIDDNLEGFWWMLFSAQIRAHESGSQLTDLLSEWCAAKDRSGANPMYSAEMLKKLPGRLNILIDGVETAVEANRTNVFVESLFRFLSTLQNDTLFSEKVRFRLFIRSDLPVGIQNVEQQVHGRRLDLRWDETSIFHYVLAEISRNEWFRKNFSDVCSEIDNYGDLVRSGSLQPDEYEPLLLRVFPQKLRRNNLSTMTFLRTYFSDAAGEGDSRSSFYPRVFGAFFTKVAELGETRGTQSLDAGRVSHDVVLEAFEYAARDFINEVKQELNFALDLGSSVDQNRKFVADLLQSFSGLQTPFILDRCVEALEEKLPGDIPKKSIRESLRRMKDMGIFEDHPSDPTRWRAGRLFKEGLRMKYVRKIP